MDRKRNGMAVLSRRKMDWYAHSEKILLTIHSYQAKSVAKILRLKHPSYEIIFRPYGYADTIIDLVEAPTLDKAKHLAELCYTEWKSINPNRGENNQD